MKTTFAGRAAESVVADYLKNQKYEILAQNWRTRNCEIDVIAKKDKIVYLVEVKYRASNAQGDGFDYITPKKLKQMQFAAEVWAADNNWLGDLDLLAAAVDGDNNVQLVEV